MMCGIAGIVSLDGQPLTGIEQTLNRMTLLLRHRGPDGEGYWVSPDRRVGLANTRLSIVGVQDDPLLPLRDADDRGVLTFNGEIYNHKVLRKGLAERGCRFSTGTDTEVLLNGLLEYGSPFLEMADGFWGFGFYDVTDRSVLIARDLMGEKPVYFAEFGNCLYFASEVPSLLSALPKFQVKLNPSAIVCGFQYRSAEPRTTLVEGVQRLAAGCALLIDVKTGEVKQERLQRLQPEKWFDFFSAGPDEETVIRTYGEQIALSCAQRMPAEVDFFATLSGGLDSTLVNYFLADQNNKTVNSLFGISTERSPQIGPDLSEMQASQYTADKIKSNWHSFSMFDTDAIALYQSAAENSYDGIFCEGVANFQQLAAETKRERKKVLLLSDGPDELLGGYDVDLKAFRLSMRLANFPSAAKRALMDRAMDVEHMRGKPSALLNWSYLVTQPFAVRPNHCGTRPHEMISLFEDPYSECAFKAFGKIDSCYEDIVSELDLSQKMALGYASSSLPDYINTRSDRGTMRESIESRMPFQSVGLVELFVATPARWRLCGGQWSKYLLRRLVEDKVGHVVAYRSKYGFAQPLWKIKGMAEQLRVQEAIMDSPVFLDAPFKSNAREFLADPDNIRLGWMAYCLAQTAYNLTQNTFH